MLGCTEENGESKELQTDPSTPHSIKLKIPTFISRLSVLFFLLFVCLFVCFGVVLGGGVVRLFFYCLVLHSHLSSQVSSHLSKGFQL